MRPDPLFLLLPTLAFSTACVVVLALRGPMRRRAGAGMAYGLWCLPVLVPLALALPAPRQAIVQMQAHAGLPVALPMQLLPAAGLHGGGWWLAWLAGALACLGWQAWRQWRFVHALGPLQPLAHPLLPLCRASHDPGLPALVGLWRPRIVLPPDFEHRYDPAQRALLLRHESVHWRRGDPQCNAVATLLLCLQWFNPLAHLAWAAFRRDQEMACDARVLADRPRQRRTYAEAMLIGGVQAPLPPLGCPWPSRHPLKERIEMLKLPGASRRRRVAAALCIGLLGAGGAYVAWAARPASGGDVVAGATQPRYRTEVELTIDGEQRQFALVEQAGRWMGFGGDGKLGHWDAQMRWMLLPDGRMRLEMKLSMAGQSVAEPVLEVRRERPVATVDVTNRDGRSRLTAVLRAVEVKDADAEAEITMRTLPPPRYPKVAYEQGIGGDVLLEVSVRADGSVSDVVVVESRPAGVFDEATVAAARQWHFNPQMKQGRPVAGKVRVPVNFALDADAPANPSMAMR